jgi:protocatechuate 3,4-dioxygenase beta subunit
MRLTRFLSKHRSAVIVGLPAIPALAALVAVAQTPPPGGGSGAIFTTTPDGSIVNENVHYEDKREVYLDGGPPGNAPSLAAGLDAGLYVFQVTDPPGKFLLSEDPARCRVVEVSNDGVIGRRVPPTEIPGLGATSDYWEDPPDGESTNGKAKSNSHGAADPTTLLCHINDDPEGEAGASGQHDTNLDVDHGDDAGAIVVQLMPYGTTPNPGGVYKAWLTPLPAYTGGGGDLNAIPSQLPPGKQKPHDCPDFCADSDPGFGPSRRFVKTDNFKVEEVVPPPMLHVRKFHDINGDGMQDVGEPEIGKNGEPVDAQCVEGDGTLDEDCDTGGGWPIWITDPTMVQNSYFTPVWITSEPPGTWIVQEGTFSNWQQSVVFLDDVDLGATNPVNVLVEGLADESHDVLFGNFMPVEVHGKKVIDLNADGDISGDSCNLDPDPWDNNDGCRGVTVYLSGTDNMGNSVDETTTTNADGEFSFTGIKPGMYTISIGEPDGFYCSFPESCDYDIDVESGDIEANLDFGDFSKPEVYGTKYIDLDADGEKDDGEGCPAAPNVNNAGCEGVTIKLDGTDGMGNGVHLSTTTDENGDYSFTDLNPGEYTLTVMEPEGFYCSAPSPCQHEITLVSDEIAEDLDFGDYSLVEVHGTKFIDLDGNGQQDVGEGCPVEPSVNNLGCDGITIHLFGTDGAGNDVHEHTTTDPNGDYSFVDLVPGQYKACEEIPDGFYQSFPASGADCNGHTTEAAEGTTIGLVGYDLTLVSDDVAMDKDFGNFSPSEVQVHKFFDFNENGVPDEGEGDLEGIEFCLKDAGGNLVEADDFVLDATVTAACQTTDADGMASWTGLLPGTYAIEETLPTGFFATTSVSTTSVLVSSEVKVVGVGNVANCVGLTPGYWSNWRNHYTEEQFLSLLAGTVASSIEEADFFLSSIGCDGGDALHCMRRFLLANQLTLNLTQNPDLPNPSGGSLFLACQIPQVPGETLGDVINQALAILADPGSFLRDFILAVKNELDAFANAFFVVNGS